MNPAFNSELFNLQVNSLNSELMNMASTNQTAEAMNYLSTIIQFIQFLTNTHLKHTLNHSVILIIHSFLSRILL